MSKIVGHISQVIGPVVDVYFKFEEGQDVEHALPKIHDAMTIARNDGRTLVIEVQQHIGEEYEGVISSITSWGMYVELPNTIEGLIHVANLYDDRYYYNENTHEMVGSDLGKIYKLGQSIRVRVLDADKENATIDFVPAAIWG